MFADTSIYHADYHSGKTSICKWLRVTEQATGDGTTVKSDIKNVVQVRVYSVHCCSAPLPKVTANENSKTLVHQKNKYTLSFRP
jgi:hypothetical protein